MAVEKIFDITIFGATGFTGKFVFLEAVKSGALKKYSIAVGGRNKEKLEKVVKDIEHETESLEEMARQSKLVINCVGPYRFFGEPVVNACVKHACHHIDISGEPQYLERMQLEYNALAKEKEIYVVGACGFDSIPADMGVVYLSKKFEGELNSVEVYLSSQAPKGSSFHYATWQSAIYGFAHANELKPLRRKLYPERLPEFKPKLKTRSVIHYSPLVKKYCLPFPGSDRSVVNRSQRHFFENRRQRPVQMLAYVAQESILTTIGTIFVAAMFGLLASFRFGRSLLEKYPRFFSLGAFSHEGPTREEMDAMSFEMVFHGRGWQEKTAEPTDQHVEKPDKTLDVKVFGPEPGYYTCSITALQSAITVLEEKEKMPNGGGVFPPGAAFADTSLIDRLEANGLHFEVIKARL
ncbi:hypothetical protein QYM36_002372 [Artemia franciscana]|uniref:Saccharopine dehydrogenase NADP binding domain-containing protein n=1 Tax=Artemia franciscana TaxID=6661 RepID=A0AA88INR9_ARTSF|nr:hypothetical protein QYM36_002372 [Artemia franciscana]